VQYEFAVLIDKCIKNIDVLRKWKEVDFAFPPPKNIPDEVLGYYQSAYETVEEAIEAEEQGWILT
jgi:hypothetical protein